MQVGVQRCFCRKVLLAKAYTSLCLGQPDSNKATCSHLLDTYISCPVRCFRYLPSVRVAISTGTRVPYTLHHQSSRPPELARHSERGPRVLKVLYTCPWLLWVSPNGPPCQRRGPEGLSGTARPTPFCSQLYRYNGLHLSCAGPFHRNCKDWPF
ncbi:hypothetical protein ABBQ32_001161 [Trebouxia sp. C0010 RCD-2024]